MNRRSKATSSKSKTVKPSAKAPALLFTCEHGGHEIPKAYQRYFRGQREILKSHRGWDPGALELAEHFAASTNAPLFSSTVSRLLVELNRSLHHRALFSEFTRDLSPQEQTTIVQTYYLPHREAVEKWIRQRIAAGQRVLHIGVHSFTPKLNGKVRKADIGLLYDPQRSSELKFCRAWRAQLLEQSPGLIVRKNYPYLGTSDGFTTYLRTKFTPVQYAGVELEVNQKYAQGPAAPWASLQAALVASLLQSAT